MKAMARTSAQQVLHRGQAELRPHPERPEAIRRTFLLTVEGERDDIGGIDPTLDLCPHFPGCLKTHHLPASAEHLGRRAQRPAPGGAD